MTRRRDKDNPEMMHTPARQPQGKCNVSQCKISFACAACHSTYQPPCATHTSPPAPAAYPLMDEDIKELIDYSNAEDVEACIRDICERIKARPIDNAFGYENVCNQDKCIKQRAAAAKAAREDECERIYGLFHEVERLHLNGMAYPDLYNEMVERIKFIHTEPLSKDGRKKKPQAQQENTSSKE